MLHPLVTLGHTVRIQLVGLCFAENAQLLLYSFRARDDRAIHNEFTCLNFRPAGIANALPYIQNLFPVNNFAHAPLLTCLKKVLSYFFFWLGEDIF